MATYIQGVTDYIPDYQPFQPDLNFYSNFMEGKQNEYDKNWKGLSNLYGQYFYADLTREDNIEKRDKLMKQIDFNLNRVSGLDLSLEQNVEQAAQVFTPFYEDKFLMKDMAYTKNFNSNIGQAQSLKNSKDEKERAQYWDAGIKAMLYQKEEFRTSDLDATLGMSTPIYTPYVNAVEKYLKMAKDLGISADITYTDGRYFVRNKNGDQLLQPLENIFSATMANDPGLQDVYRTQAYVNRKDYIEQNKTNPQFEGNLGNVERDYLMKQYATIQEYAQQRSSEYKQNTQDVSNKLDKTDQKLKSGQGNQFTPSYKSSLEEALGIAQTNEQAAEQLVETLNDKPSMTPSTMGGAPVMDDIDKLRFQVDAGVASMLADQDIFQAAYTYSRKDMVRDMSADPYGVAAQNHQNRLSQMDMAHQYKMIELDYKSQKDLKNIQLKTELENGTMVIQDGEAIPNPALFTTLNFSGKEPGATDKNTTILAENGALAREFTKDYADGMVNALADYHSSLTTGTKPDMSAGEVANFFYGSGKKQTGLQEILPQLISGTYKPVQAIKQNTYDKGSTTLSAKSPQAFIEDYKKNPSKYLHGEGADYLRKVYNRTVEYAKVNRGDDDISKHFLESAPHAKYQEYLAYLDGAKLVTQQNRDVIEKNIKSSVTVGNWPDKLKSQITNLAVTDQLGLIDEQAFVKRVSPILQKQFKPLPSDGSTLGWYDRGLNALSPAEKKELDKRLLTEGKQKPKGTGSNFTDANGLTGREKRDITRNYLMSVYGLDSNGNRNPEASAKQMYQDIKKNYLTTVTNGKELKSFTALLNDKASGTYSTGQNGYAVSLAAPSTPGYQGYMEFLGDMKTINFYGGKNNEISFFGTNLTGVQDTKALFSNPQDAAKAAELIVNKINSMVGDKKLKPFPLMSNQRAMESRNLGAMVMYPDKTVLDALVKEEGFFTQAMSDAIALNGLSFISERDNWNNSIFNQNKVSPLEGVVNALGKYTYEDPMGAGTFTIEKNFTSASPYKIYGQRNMYGPDGEYTDNFNIPPDQYNLTELHNAMSEQFTYITQLNTAVWRQFHTQPNQSLAPNKR